MKIKKSPGFNTSTSLSFSCFSCLSLLKPFWMFFLSLFRFSPSSSYPSFASWFKFILILFLLAVPVFSQGLDTVFFNQFSSSESDTLLSNYGWESKTGNGMIRDSVLYINSAEASNQKVSVLCRESQDLKVFNYSLDLKILQGSLDVIKCYVVNSSETSQSGLGFHLTSDSVILRNQSINLASTDFRLENEKWYRLGLEKSFSHILLTVQSLENLQIIDTLFNYEYLDTTLIDIENNFFHTFFIQSPSKTESLEVELDNILLTQPIEDSTDFEFFISDWNIKRSEVFKEIRINFSLSDSSAYRYRIINTDLDTTDWSDYFQQDTLINHAYPYYGMNDPFFKIQVQIKGRILESVEYHLYVVEDVSIEDPFVNSEFETDLSGWWVQEDYKDSPSTTQSGKIIWSPDHEGSAYIKMPVVNGRRGNAGLSQYNRRVIYPGEIIECHAYMNDFWTSAGGNKLRLNDDRDITDSLIAGIGHYDQDCDTCRCPATDVDGLTFYMDQHCFLRYIVVDTISIGTKFTYFTAASPCEGRQVFLKSVDFSRAENTPPKFGAEVSPSNREGMVHVFPQEFSWQVTDPDGDSITSSFFLSTNETQLSRYLSPPIVTIKSN